MPPNASIVLLILQANIKRGKRVSTAKAFLTKDVIARDNLDIVLNARVTKLLLKGQRVTGVKFSRAGKVNLAYTRSEVILSAGAIATPQILMLSGIGSPDHLNAHGIPVRVPLWGVGNNMQSHVGVGEVIYTLKAPVAYNPVRLALNPGNYLTYLFNGDGPLSSVSGFEALGNIRTGLASANTSWPDIAINLIALHINTDGGAIYRNSVNMKPSYFNRNFNDLKLREGFTLLPSVLHPYSRGTIRLKSRNPFEPPLINANYFDDDRDVETVLQGIKKCLAIGDSPKLKKFGARLHRKPNPLCITYGQFGSDSYWRCVIRHFSYTLYHDVGTCKMGPDSDPEAVVDSRLKVYGLDNLRIGKS